MVKHWVKTRVSNIAELHPSVLRTPMFYGCALYHYRELHDNANHVFPVLNPTERYLRLTLSQPDPSFLHQHMTWSLTWLASSPLFAHWKQLVIHTIKTKGRDQFDDYAWFIDDEENLSGRLVMHRCTKKQIAIQALFGPLQPLGFAEVITEETRYDSHVCDTAGHYFQAKQS